MNIRVSLVADCSVSCNGLQNHFLAEGAGIGIETVFASGAEGLEHLTVSGFAPLGVILFAYDLPDMPAVQSAAGVQARGPAIPLVVYRAPDDEEITGELRAAGVLGYVLKRESFEALTAAILAAARGEKHINAELIVRLWTLTQHQAAETWKLNPREREILALIGEGLKNEAIAYRLNVAEQTVKNNATGLYKKLKVENRTQLMHKARTLSMWLKQTNDTGGSRNRRYLCRANYQFAPYR